jgi:GNAT superfamily N-acetyltransferase
MIFADALLARRLETAEAANARGSAGQPGVAVMGTRDGGCAIFAGAESPLSHAVAMGLNGPVSQAEIGEIETFFGSRGAKATFDVCPLADPDFVPALSARGYRITEFNNVLVKRLHGSEPTITPRARRAVADEADLWAYTVGRGFFEQPELTTQEMEIGRAIFHMEGAMCYFASTESGQLAGGAAGAIRGGLATLFADTTVREFRRTGLHSQLIAARLNDALAANCDLATASTLPGSGSQRNYERLGFQVVYTKVVMAR